MSEESTYRLVVDKAQLREDFHRLQRSLQGYRAVLDEANGAAHGAANGTAEGDAWMDDARNRLRDQQLALLRARVSIGSGELALALLRQVLARLPVHELRFRPRPVGHAGGAGNGRTGDGRTGNGLRSWLADPAEAPLSAASATPARPAGPGAAPALPELLAGLRAATETAPLEQQERLQRVLGACHDFCAALAQQNAEQLAAAIVRVNLATANAQSRSLLREIAIVTRDVYTTLQAVADELPLDALSGSSGGINEAVRRLNSVVARLDDAATQNLDELERVNRITQDEAGCLGGVLETLRESQQRLMRIKTQHPELEAALQGIQERLSDGVGASVMTLRYQLTQNGAQHMELISNQSFQELTGHTLRKIIAFVQSLETELFDLLRPYGALGEGAGAAAAGAPPAGAAQAGPSPTQTDVDKLLGELGF